MSWSSYAQPQQQVCDGISSIAASALRDRVGSTVGMMTGNQKLLNLGGKEFMKAVGRHPWEIKECPHSRASSLVEYVHSGATDSLYRTVTGRCMPTGECGFHWLPTVATKWFANIGPQACGELEWMACSQARAMWTDLVTTLLTSMAYRLINLTYCFESPKTETCFKKNLVESGRTAAPATVDVVRRGRFSLRDLREMLRRAGNAAGSRIQWGKAAWRKPSLEEFLMQP